MMSESGHGPQRITVNVPGVGSCEAFVEDAWFHTNMQNVYAGRQMDDPSPIPPAIMGTATELRATITFVWPTDMARVAQALNATATTGMGGLQ